MFSLSFCSCWPAPDPSPSQPRTSRPNSRAIFRKRGHISIRKRPDLAIPELQAAVAIDPQSVEIQGNLGVLLYFQGKPADAIPHLRAAVERQAGITKIQGLLGLAEVRTLDFAQGRKDLAAAFPLITEQKFKIEIGLELVGVDTQTGELEEATATVAELRKVAPDNPEVLYAAYRTYSALSAESMLALSLAAPDSGANAPDDGPRGKPREISAARLRSCARRLRLTRICPAFVLSWQSCCVLRRTMR